MHTFMYACLVAPCCSSTCLNNIFKRVFVHMGRDPLQDLFHVYLNKCEYHFSRLHVNKISNFCFLLNNGRVP